MNPLPPLPPALDPFTDLGPLQPLLEPLIRLLRLPLELVYAALQMAAVFANPNGPAAMAAAGTNLGAFFKLLIELLVIAVVIVVVVAALLGLGFGTLMAAAVTAYVTRRRRDKRVDC